MSKNEEKVQLHRATMVLDRAIMWWLFIWRKSAKFWKEIWSNRATVGDIITQSIFVRDRHTMNLHRATMVCEAQVQKLYK
jgi:hypothetical protein